jgi:putative nucleotidyltransferase with HDIG domain
MSEGWRLFDLLGALSLATDRGGGFPLECAVRVSLVAGRLARAWHDEPSFIRDCQLAGLLRYLGCTGSAHESARLNAGDDQGFLQLFADVDVGRPAELAARVPRLARGAPLGRRLAAMARLADPRMATAINLGHCEVACRLAERIGAAPIVVEALAQTYERFDGRGTPGAVGGTALSRVVRVVQAAQCFEVLWRLGGPKAAASTVAGRGGGQLDPEVARIAESEAGSLAKGLERSSLLQDLLSEEPLPYLLVSLDQRSDIATAFALVADLKSTFTLGHSLAVADLAERCASAMGIADRSALRAAALLHDLGRVGVPNSIWDKPEPWTRTERLRAEEHSWLTDQILRSSTLLEPLADIAGVHERLDGSGYHRRVRAVAIPPAARLLSACDVYAGLVADRPHRPALKKAAAAKILGEHARDGRLDRDAVRVLLDVVGQPPPKLRGELPKGLSPREVDVLALVARGKSNKDVARALHIAERTVKNHVARLYDKIGVRTRAGAALFAVEHDLVEAGAFEN